MTTNLSTCTHEERVFDCDVCEAAYEPRIGDVWKPPHGEAFTVFDIDDDGYIKANHGQGPHFSLAWHVQVAQWALVHREGDCELPQDADRQELAEEAARLHALIDAVRAVLWDEDHDGESVDEMALRVKEDRDRFESLSDNLNDEAVRLITEIDELRKERDAFRERAEKLWSFLDDLDTLDDAARDDYEHYRKSARAIAARRTSVATSDNGQRLVWSHGPVTTPPTVWRPPVYGIREGVHQPFYDSLTLNTDKQVVEFLTTSADVERECAAAVCDDEDRETLALMSAEPKRTNDAIRLCEALGKRGLPAPAHTTRPGPEDIDARRDMDGFSVEAELRAARAAAFDANYSTAVALYANIDEHLSRGGPRPKEWGGRDVHRMREALTTISDETSERSIWMIAQQALDPDADSHKIPERLVLRNTSVSPLCIQFDQALFELGERVNALENGPGLSFSERNGFRQTHKRLCALWRTVYVSMAPRQPVDTSGFARLARPLLIQPRQGFSVVATATAGPTPGDAPQAPARLHPGVHHCRIRGTIITSGGAGEIVVTVDFAHAAGGRYLHDFPVRVPAHQNSTTVLTRTLLRVTGAATVRQDGPIPLFNASRLHDKCVYLHVNKDGVVDNVAAAPEP